jgi:phosphosulfolactate synthase
MIENFLHLPIRNEKPRTSGITIVEDNGISLSSIQNILSTSAHLIDYVRLNASALLSKESLEQKVKFYKNNGVTPFVSGLVFEAAHLRNSVSDFIALIDKVGINCLEISEGIAEIKPEQKALLISKYKNQFEILSKIGPQKKDYVFNSENWKKYIETSIKAGANKVIIEGSEAGIGQNVNGLLEVNDVLAHGISHYTDLEKIIWEAPYVPQQLWFVTRFGAQVNLANINLHEILNLETIRLGLHADSLLHYLPSQITVGKIREIDNIYNFDWQI